MNQYVVIGFDENYLQFGLSALISLRQFAKYQGNVIVVAVNLTPASQTKIRGLATEIITVSGQGNIREIVWETIIAQGKKRPGVYAFWDADVWFQEPIDEVFSLAETKFFATPKQGFLAGPHSMWSKLNEIKNATSLTENDDSTFAVLIGCFNKFVVEASPTWNFTDIPALKDDGKHLTCNGMVVKTIHPSGFIRDFTPNRKVLFWERHHDLFEQYSEQKRKVLRFTPQLNSVQHNT